MSDFTDVMPEYDESDISSPERLEVVRATPNLFFPDLEYAGLTHAAIEPIDNSIDELWVMHKAGTVGSIEVVLCPDVERETFQFVIRDNGRGIPRNKLFDCVTKLSSSGKRNSRAYMKSSAGQFGYGLKGTAGTSNMFRTITKRPDCIGAVYVNKGLHADSATIIDDPQDATGTLTYYEPDKTIFVGVETYSQSRYTDIITRLERLSYFYPFNIQFKISNVPVSNDLWIAPAGMAWDMADDLIRNANVIFDSSTFDKNKWLLNTLKVRNPVLWEVNLHKELSADPEDRLSYNLRVLYSGQERQYGRIGLINSLPIDSITSDHLSVVQKALHAQLAKRITNPKVKAWYIENGTSLPIHIVAEVRYKEGRMAGATKMAFIDATFREACGEDLDTKLNAIKDHVDLLFSEIYPSIEDAYIASMRGYKSNKDRKNRLLNISDERFKDCDTKDRSKAELFMVEGSSAGGLILDRDTQGLIQLQGKPLNGIKVSTDQLVRYSAVSKDPIYKDLMEVLNIHPGCTDLSNLYFDKLIILTDADSHGRHIASIVISNLCDICPEFVASGKVYIALPPDYGITYKKSADNVRTYHRNLNEVEIYLAMHYRYIYDIKLMIRNCHDKYQELDDIQFINFAKIVKNIGLILDNMEKEFSIPAMLIYQLTLVSQYLEKGRVNTQQIADALQAESVIYEPIDHILTISVASSDYVIPLHRLRERMYQRLTTILGAIQSRWLSIKISAKNIPGYKDVEVTPAQLYALFSEIDKLFYIEKFKGLAGMSPEDIYKTCQDPATRNLTRITKVSDIDGIYDLLGKDTRARQSIITDRKGAVKLDRALGIW